MIEAAVASLIVVTPLIWLFVNYLPTSEMCYFRDIGVLRALWPHDLFFFNQMMAENFSEKDQCVFFAANSLSSLYWASTLVALLCNLPAPQRKYRPPRSVQTVALVSLFLFIYIVFFDGFNDHAFGRGALIAYRTTDTAGLLFAKTVFRFFLLYSLTCVWILTAWIRWRSDHEA